MRKLPPDEEVYRLRQSGMSAKDIAKMFGAARADIVYLAIRRYEGKRTHNDDIKAVNPSHAFNHAGHDPVEHRDTGKGIGFGKIQDVYRPQRLSIKECGDLLREWGVK